MKAARSRVASFARIAITGLALPASMLAQRDTLAVRESVLVTRHTPVLVRTLRRLADAQTAYFAQHRHYSATLDTLGLAVDLAPGVNVAILFTDSAGWSAVGVHDSVPGLECWMTDEQRPPRPEDSLTGRLHCKSRRLGTFAPDSLTFAVSPGPSFRAPEPSALCYRQRMTPIMAAHFPTRQQGLIEFMLGSDGKPEISGLIVVESSSAELTTVGLELVEKCQFRPAQVYGKPVRALIRLPIRLGPQ
jgi:hypothetical protein